jgi:hypothetical protein
MAQAAIAHAVTTQAGRAQVKGVLLDAWMFMLHQRYSQQGVGKALATLSADVRHEHPRCAARAEDTCEFVFTWASAPN